MIYVYPKFPAVHNWGFLRIGGSGLANCLFVYARAIAIAHKYNAKLIAPSWFNFGIGPYLRRENDKRHYLGLFNDNGEISGIKKAYVLLSYKHVSESEKFDINENIVIDVIGIETYFKPIIKSHHIVAPYIIDHILPHNLASLRQFDFSDSIAVHVRLGDYLPERRIPLSWYKARIRDYRNEHQHCKVLLFSDGKDEELLELISIEGVRRVFFGNAIADIVAISKCQYLIGSDSTFSAWGAYLGQIPCIFNKLKSAPLLIDQSKESIEANTNKKI